MEEKINVVKSKKLSFNLFVMLLGMVPMFIVAVILAVVGITSVESELLEATNEKLSMAASSSSAYFGVDWTDWMKNGIAVTDEEYVDACLPEGIEQTIFRAESDGSVKRYLSSIRDESGARVSGTTTSDEITEKVYGKGETYFGDGVVINGKKYFVCYKPIKDETGKIVGMSFAGESDDEISKAITSIVLKVVIIALICAIIAAAVIILIAKLVVKAIAGITDATVRLSEGYINDTIEVNTFIKEIEQITDAANKLQNNLQLIVGDIKETSGSLSTSVSETNDSCTSSAEGAEQINSAVAELATASQSMAESVQSLNEDIIEIGNSINTIEGGARSLSSSSVAMNEISNKAKEDINSVYASSEQSVQAANDIANHMADLSAAINEVSEATKLISDISTQTNLLSLNASIEAARAGEAGKGFAVVAGEISSLANQSDEGVKKIDSVVNKVLELSNKSMELTEQIKKIIANEQSMVKSTQDSFIKLKTEIDNSIVQIESISSDAIKLADVKDSAVGAVSDLSAISEENAASTEEVTASIENLAANIKDISVRSDDMKSMSDSLLDAIKAFKD